MTLEPPACSNSVLYVMFLIFIRSLNPSPPPCVLYNILLSPLLPAIPGAGCHNESTSRELKALCRRTCKEVWYMATILIIYNPGLILGSTDSRIYFSSQVLETLKAGRSANEAVALAVSTLEVCYPQCL